MKTYLVRLRCLSPYLTPWRNSTLWGRFCWIIADERLDGWTIADWLECYQIDKPPLIVGDALPSNAVPVPAIYHAIPRADGEKTPKTLPWEEWQQLCATGSFPEPKKPEPKKEDSDAAPSKNGKVQRVERMHVVMDRASGRAVDGGLRSEHGYQPEELVIVAQADDTLGREGVEKLFKELCLEGWGQGRTYGYGAIKLIGVTEIERPDPTRWVVTLGHCHPTDELPQEGYWRWSGVPVRPHDSETRRGPTQLFTTMLLPGATFSADKPCIGRNLGIAGHDEYLHYGITPTWPTKQGRD